MELVDDVFYHICSFLSIIELFHLEQTCKNLKQRIRIHPLNNIHLAKTHIYYNKLTKYHSIKTTTSWDLLKITDNTILLWELKENESKHKYCNGLLYYTRKWASRNNCYRLFGIYNNFPILYWFCCGCKIGSDEYGNKYSQAYYCYDVRVTHCSFCKKQLRGLPHPNIIFITTQAKYFLKKYKKIKNISGKGESTKRYFESTSRKVYTCSIDQIKLHINNVSN